MASNYFQIANSPTVAARADQQVTEIYKLVLAPFSLPPKLEFNEVPVGSTALRILNVHNPTDLIVKVVLVIPKNFAAEGLNVSWHEFVINPRDRAVLEVTFKPIKLLHNRFIIHFKDVTQNFKGHFQITAHSVARKKTMKRIGRTRNINQNPVCGPAAGAVIDSFSTSKSAPDRQILGELSVAASANASTSQTFSFNVSTECGNATYVCKEKSLSGEGMDVVFEDSLEVETIPDQKVEVESARTSPNLTLESNKENSPSSIAKTRTPRVRHSFDLISAMGFDNLTPDETANFGGNRVKLLSFAQLDPCSPLPGSSKIEVTHEHEELQQPYETDAEIKSTEIQSVLAEAFQISPPMLSVGESSFKPPSSTPFKSQQDDSFYDANCSRVSNISKMSPRMTGPVMFVPEQSSTSALSPKSLVSFKKPKVRAHLLPPRNVASSRPTSASSSTILEETTEFHTAVSHSTSSTFYHSFRPSCDSVILYSNALEDPFSRNAIHSLEYQDQQATELIKWVNSVLTIPDEYSVFESGNVDVAQLWKKSIASDSVVLPASREAVCSEYHKDETHLSNLRKRASQVFKAREMTETLYKVHAKISSGFICIKDDIDLHCDQGARYLLVQLLMYYNPLWLRIGLEAIYGRSIPLKQKNMVVGLMIFIKNNFLSDQYIIKRNTCRNSPYHKMPNFKREMNNHIIFKFFSLLLFLDVAKKKTIVPYNPCLFNANSPIKESEGMLTEFIKEFIKCVGKMMKTFQSIGFVLTHKQIPIEECDFAVRTHLDMRDGARLARLMELVLRKNDLLQKLRFPAISRLQKVHNVKLAFDALEEKGAAIVDVKPSEVVDGHREKTMSLLWQVLHKFLKPQQERAARTIQVWWRATSWRIRLSRKMAEKKERELTIAATTIQSHWRGYLCRKSFPKLRSILIAERKEREEKNEEAMLRRVSDYERILAAAKTIQTRYRATLLMRQQRDSYQLQRTAAIKIQRWYRAIVVGRQDRSEYERKLAAAKTIQIHYRATLLMRQQRDSYQLQRTAAIKIQRWYRAIVVGRQDRSEYERKLAAAKTIQIRYRATLLMRQQRDSYQLQRTAAIKIQRWYRAIVVGRKDRSEYERKLAAAKTIQIRYRATLLMRQQRDSYQLQRTAAIKIQRWYRAHRARVAAGIAHPPAPSNPTLSDIYKETTYSILHAQTQRKYSLHLVYVAFKNLDFVVGYSPVLCEKLSATPLEYVFREMYYHMSVNCRSIVYLDIFKHILNVLLTLSRFQPTYDTVWKLTEKYNGFTVLNELLFKYYISNRDLFCKAATILWLLSMNVDEVQAIKRQSNMVSVLTYLKNRVPSTQPKRNTRPIVLPRTGPVWGQSGDTKHLFSSPHDALVILSKRFL